MRTRNAIVAVDLFRTSHRLSNETTGTRLKIASQKPTKVRSLYGSFYTARYDSPERAVLQLQTNIYISLPVYIAPATLSLLYTAERSDRAPL